MKFPVLCALLLIGQLAVSKEVVRLPPGKTTILQEYGGKVVELLNAPAEVDLPVLKTLPGAQPTPWSVDIRNLGPHDVVIRNGSQLTVLLHPSEFATIASHGRSIYVRVR